MKNCGGGRKSSANAPYSVTSDVLPPPRPVPPPAAARRRGGTFLWPDRLSAPCVVVCAPAMPGDRPARCPWARSDSAMIAYHDGEWGVPVHDDAHPTSSAV